MTIREIKQTTSFRRDYKKYYSNDEVRKILAKVLDCIINNISLDRKYNNHPLNGEFKGCYDCHIMLDVVLIYKLDENTVELIRLGSHSELY